MPRRRHLAWREALWALVQGIGLRTGTAPRRLTPEEIAEIQRLADDCR